MLLYQEIKHYIFSLIAKHPEMKKLPSERELVEHFKSTRITVREALIHLEAEGIIYRLNRKGWFICPPRLRWDPIQKANFYQLAKEQNFSADTRLLSANEQLQQGEIAAAFACQSVNLFNISRVRSLDDRPVVLEEIYCQAKSFQGLLDKDLHGSVTEIFAQDYNVAVVKESSNIFVTTLPANKAEHLQLNEGASCLKIIRQRFTADNLLVDYNYEYWVHGAIEICVASR